MRDAADLFTPLYNATKGVDGRVSIEVDPRHRPRHRTPPTPQAQELSKIVDRPNLLVKIPATVEGLPAITETLARGSASTSR